MADIVEFMTARLAEDEASEWPHRPSCQMLKPVPEGLPEWFGGSFSCNCDATTRWLRDIEAKRRIVDAYQKAQDAGDSALWTGGEMAVIWALEAALQALAQQHDGHPDFDPAWKLS